MEKKLIKPLLASAIILLAALACGSGNGHPTPLSASPTVKVWTVPPSVIPRQPRTPTPSFFLALPTPIVKPEFPEWTVNFSDPILAALDGQPPHFQDEFLNFDQGWFYFVPDSPKGPYYAHIQDEALLLKLPAENEKRDYWAYNPRLLRKNFALGFELRFLESQPEDMVRFQFDQSADRNVAFDLFKNQNWALRWGTVSNQQALTGTYPHFPPDPIAVMVLVKDRECAIYLDAAPLVHVADCRAEAVRRSSPWAMTFHILAEPGHIASASIDNLKLWDLDEIP